MSNTAGLRIANYARPRSATVIAAIVSLIFATLACAQGVRPGHPGLDVSQEMIPPLIEGVAYDQSRNQVFVSLCQTRTYDCDLATIDLVARELRYVRSEGAYGYTRPAVSEDGRFAFAVRTPRRQRPSQRDIDQQVVRIDLTAGEETVVASSGDFRFDRLVPVGGDAILAVRSYRSSDQVQCRGDFCTDVARLVLVERTGMREAPFVVAADGALGQGMLQIVSLGGGGVWIVGSGGELFYQNSLPLRTAGAWLLDIGPFSVHGPAGTLTAEQELFQQFASSSSNSVRWRWDQLAATGRRLELRQFREDLTTVGGVGQVGLTPAGRGVRVTKRRNGRAVRFEIEVVENRGVSPWQAIDVVSVGYAPPN